MLCGMCNRVILFGLGQTQSRTQSNACTRARMALALGKLTTGTPKFRGSGFVGMHVKPITAQEKFNFPRANAILARAQALLWVRDWGKPVSFHTNFSTKGIGSNMPSSALKLATSADVEIFSHEVKISNTIDIFIRTSRGQIPTNTIHIREKLAELAGG